MTAIYSLASVSDASAQLTTINTNIDGLEAAIGAQTDAASATGPLLARIAALALLVDGLEGAIGTTGDAASATGSILARLGNIIAQLTTIAGFVDGLEGFTDGIEGVLGLASATPGANTINANILRVLSAASNCSRSVAPPVAVAVAASGSAATTLIGPASAGTDWRRIAIYNSGSVPVLMGIGITATASLYSFPLPPGILIVKETLVNITALSTGAAGSCIVTVET